MKQYLCGLPYLEVKMLKNQLKSLESSIPHYIENEKILFQFTLATLMRHNLHTSFLTYL